jgi:hypothetical protein
VASARDLKPLAGVLCVLSLALCATAGKAQDLDPQTLRIEAGRLSLWVGFAEGELNFQTPEAETADGVYLTLYEASLDLERFRGHGCLVGALSGPLCEPFRPAWLKVPVSGRYDFAQVRQFQEALQGEVLRTLTPVCGPDLAKCTGD